MTKYEAIAALNAGKKLKHRSFLHDEFIHVQCGIITGSDGTKHDEFWVDHSQPEWDKDWELIPEDIIEIEIGERKKAMQISGPDSGKYYLVEEIELGAGPHKKAVAYTEGMMQKKAQCKAVVIAPGKVRIIL